MKWVITGILILIFTGLAQAIKVGVIIDFPNQETFMKCLDLAEGSDGYDLLEATGLGIVWSPPSQWGHGLCGIEGTGCPSDNCFCGGEEYWGIYLAEDGETSWDYLPVGFDAGSECWNRDQNSFDGHYCIAEGDVFGLRWGTYDQLPEYGSFREICKKRRDREHKKLNVFFEPVNPLVEQEITVNTEIKKANVRVLSDGGRKIVEGETGDDGKTKFTLSSAGNYKIQVTATGYPHKYLDLIVSPSTTSTVTTTSVPQITSTIKASTSAIPTSTVATSSSTTSSITSSSTSSSTSSLNPKSQLIQSVADDLTGKAVAVPKTNGKGILEKAGVVFLLLLVASLAALFLRKKE
ncbi:MAG: carboxypeptidase-like regulatory domain-containing protein [Candidatus Altiarchaeota archaeon]